MQAKLPEFTEQFMWKLITKKRMGKLGSLSMLSARIKKRHSQSLTYHLPHGCVVDVFMSLGEVVLMKHFIILEMLNCALGWQWPL